MQKKKKEFFRKKFEVHCKEKNVKGTYDLAKKLMGWETSSHPTMFVIRGKIYRKPRDLANELQKYYSEKVKKLIGGLKRRGRDPLIFLNRAMQKWQGKVNLPIFNLRKINEIETLNIIKQLSNTSAHGRDDLDALTIKMAAGALVRPLTHIINTSIGTSSFASKWKVAKVIPILKSSDSSKMDPASFRPVSLLPVVSKIVERSVQSQLQDHMEQQGLLSKNSHAYRRNLSTSTAMMQIVDELHSATERNQISELLALDQKAAFDMVSHTILVDKMKVYGCSNNTITWLRNYLEFRSQFVSVGSHSSRIVATGRGVPQGSILGPFLYLMYTNEINEVIKNALIARTKHMKIIQNYLEITAINVEGLLHMQMTRRTTLRMTIEFQTKSKSTENMKKLEDYLTDNELVINAEKTAILEAMIKQKKGRTVGEPPNLLVITSEGTRKVITDKKEMRILGNKPGTESWVGWLIWKGGKKQLFQPLGRFLDLLQQVGRMLPRNSRKLLSEGLIMSKLQYVITQWGGAPSNQIRLAQRLQNKCARWITGCGARTRITSLLDEVGWMSMKELTEKHSLVQMWKILYLNKPEIMREKIVVDNEMKIELNLPRLQFTLQSFYWRTSVQWNSLPQNMRELNKLPMFKTRLKTWMKWRRDNETDSELEPD